MIPHADGEITYLYAVHEGDSDRSNGTPRWFFTDRSKAVEIAKGRGWYCGDSPISKIPVIWVNNKAYRLVESTQPDWDITQKIDVSPDDELRKKQAALAKLTPEERKLLGL